MELKANSMLNCLFVKSKASITSALYVERIPSAKYGPGIKRHIRHSKEYLCTIRRGSTMYFDSRSQQVREVRRPNGELSRGGSAAARSLIAIYRWSYALIILLQRDAYDKGRWPARL
mmetsp:Transcript_7844/g.17226  ORF Transcript_7844/g.17226 Transcript_7844/m.17226 type:complete len:117 (-) Transcript_7844:16-366(-)